ncbi:hypothetical protein QUF73_14765 [Cytobacillus sp. NJ13]|nr:hypothetical protein [Cytobacillus sp. NJ13]
MTAVEKLNLATIYSLFFPLRNSIQLGDKSLLRGNWLKVNEKADNEKAAIV